jgi:hypothetical protein
LIATANEHTDVITWLAIGASTGALVTAVFAFWLRTRRAIPKPKGRPVNRPVDLTIAPTPSPASSVLDWPTGQKPDELEKLLASTAVGSEKVQRASNLLATSTVLALGRGVGERTADGTHTESDLLHFTTEQDGVEHVYLPVFTRADTLRRALEQNPDWREQDVLQIDAGDLLNARGPDVALAVNPWSHLALAIPPPTEAAETATAAGAEPQ